MGAPGPVDKPTIKSVLTWKRMGDNTVDQINFWSYTGSAPSASDLAAFAVDIVSAAETAFAPLCDTFTGVVSATMTDISVSPAVQGEGGTSWVGTRTGAQLSPATSMVINKKPANPYRGGKPKNFLPFGTGGDVADTGLWASAIVSASETAYTNWANNVGAFTSGGTSFDVEVMVSYYTGGSIVTISPTTGRARNTPKKRGVTYSGGTVSGTWSPKQFSLGSHVASDIIGSQRRRNRNA